MIIFMIIVFNVNMKQPKPKIVINVTSIEDKNYSYFLFPQRPQFVLMNFKNLRIFIMS